MRTGLDAAAAGQHETALDHFRRAMQLVPEANVPHRAAAKSLEALGRWGEAIAEYETYLRIKSDVSDAQAIRDRIDEIKRTRLFGEIRLDCTPSPSAITVDGAPATPNAEGTIRVAVGKHVVRVAAPGHDERTMDVVVGAGETATPACTLAPSAATIALPAGGAPRRDDAPRPEKPASSPWYAKWWTWAGAGAVVAGATVLVIVLASGGSHPPPSTEGGNHGFP